MSKLKDSLRRWLLAPKLPDHLAQRFLELDENDLRKVADSLRQNFFSQSPDGWLSTDLGKKDLQDHLLVRLEADRRYRIPWLDRARPLLGSRVLEIGCGTGSSTVALAEQGADVVACDIDELALTDARTRCDAYKLEVKIIKCDATDAASTLDGENFDMIVFWACLEHLTIEERLSAITETFRMLPRDGLFCITDTPNRLWFHDFHTSFLPFYMWLPDELAIKYSRFSPRERFRDAFASQDGDNAGLSLARWGRGASFHEFSLAIGPVENLDVVSCMETFNRKQRIFARLKWMLSFDHRFEQSLRRVGPCVHEAFFQPNLDLIIRKT